MKRPKDMQRHKAYRAENAAFGYVPKTSPPTLPEMKQVRAYVQKVTDWILTPGSAAHKAGFVASIWLPARTGDGRGHRNATGGVGGLSLPMWARREWVILHEIAHHCVELEQIRKIWNPGERMHAAHGWRWAQCYLLLVRRFLGVAAHNTLRDSFKAHGVKYRPPRQRAARELTPEEKMARAMRLANARAAKAVKLAAKSA